MVKKAAEGTAVEGQQKKEWKVNENNQVVKVNNQ
jgi:hypothetical protein